MLDDRADLKCQRLMQIYQEDLLKVFQAIANKDRLDILMLLFSHEMRFQDLLALSKLKKTALSHHLRVLEEIILICKPVWGNYLITKDGKLHFME